MLQRSESVPGNLFVIWNCYTPLFLPYIFIECANFRTGTFCTSALLRALSSSAVQRLVVRFLAIRTVFQNQFLSCFQVEMTMLRSCNGAVHNTITSGN